MNNRIKVLPDSVANQIAAGEVVQRPASVVKELLENAVDAGATEITLNVKDAGRSLIQVMDNGDGMSEIDARLCMERHATSKIKDVNDIFRISTMGFRGEALASITAVSQSEIKTKTDEDELAIVIKMSGNEVQSQESETGNKGTRISVKNLFFNVPARRNFLKSNNVEYRHILESFQQISLTRPDVAFRMFNNDKEVYRLDKSNLRQRIIQLFGKRFNERLVPIKESLDLVEISGFVGKPDFATAKRGEQFFFVNDRYIRSPYFHHAVMQAYEDLLPGDSYPQYFIYLKVDPAQLDVNIHPTKTEVKFVEEKSIYAVLRTTIRQSLGKFNIAPTLDFERETAFDSPTFDKKRSISIPQITVDKKYNPFKTDTVLVQKSPRSNENLRYAQSLYEHASPEEKKEASLELPDEDNGRPGSKIIQLHNKFILTHLKTGFMVIDQHRAHQRILYDSFVDSNQEQPSQQLLFPTLIELSRADFDLVKEQIEELKSLGFSVEIFGKDSISVNGIPVGCAENEIEPVFMSIIEVLKSEGKKKKNIRDRLAMQLAGNLAIPAGRTLEEKEMVDLVDRLFACEMPFSLPSGKPIVITLPLDDLNKRFQY